MTNGDLVACGLGQLFGGAGWNDPVPLQPISNPYQNVTDEQIAAGWQRLWEMAQEARTRDYLSYTPERLGRLGERIAAAKQRHGIA